MDADELSRLLLLGYMVADDDLWHDQERMDIGRMEPEREKRIWVRPWIHRRHDDSSNTMYKLQCEISALHDEFEFRAMLRMNEGQYVNILDKVRPLIERQNTKFRPAVTAEEKLSTTLTYLAYGGTMSLLSRMYRLGRSTIHEALDDTCPAIYSVLKDDFLTTPTTQDAWREIIMGFEQRWNFPNCLGGLDGKHIRIHCPADSGSFYFNYKGSYSVVLLGLVDADYKFTYLDIGSEGRVADGGIWRRSSLYTWLKAGILNLPPPKSWPHGEEYGTQNHAIVADDAFALSTSLMKPYSARSLTKTQRIFNYRLSRARRVTENAFGIMSNRFRILLTNVYRTPDRVVQMCLCIGALHNYLRVTGGNEYLGVGSVDLEDANHEMIPGEWRRDTQLQAVQPSQDRNSPKDAKLMRDRMAHYFTEGAGRVGWQDKAIE